MKRNEIFDLKTSNGILSAVVIDRIYCENSSHYADYYWHKEVLLCYGQNRLFTVVIETHEADGEPHEVLNPPYGSPEDGTMYETIYDTIEVTEDPKIEKILCEYCIMPEFDNILNNGKTR